LSSAPIQSIEVNGHGVIILYRCCKEKLVTIGRPHKLAVIQEVRMVGHRIATVTQGRPNELKPAHGKDHKAVRVIV
jgi:hypothetical protein